MFKRLWRCLILFALVATPASGWAQATTARQTISEEEKAEIISERFRFYNKNFPQISFAHVSGGAEWRDDFTAIATLLGEHPISLDYQHPSELAKDVMLVNLQRLVFMLENNIVSASLYRADKGSSLQRKPLCVITLNPDSYISNSLEATAYMLDLPDEILQKIHPSRLLDPADHIRFTIDHEAYHCLDSYILGGAPITHKKFGGNYNFFRRESGADAYALAMHRRRSNGTSHYARNITHIRSLWLFTDGPNWCTYESMREIYQMPVQTLKEKTIREVFNLASTIRDDKAGDYNFYIKQRASAFRAAKALGYPVNLYGSQWQGIENIKTDPARANYKINQYKYYYKHLFTDEPIEFRPIDPAKEK